MAVSYDKYIVMALTYVIVLIVVCMAMTWEISLLLWIFYVFLSYVCYAFVHVCLYVPCGHLLGKG